MGTWDKNLQRNVVKEDSSPVKGYSAVREFPSTWKALPLHSLSAHHQQMTIAFARLSVFPQEKLFPSNHLVHPSLKHLLFCIVIDLLKCHYWLRLSFMPTVSSCPGWPSTDRS